jgi:DNA-binding MarR family transcriptional regulator
VIVQNRSTETIEADIEERGPLADRLLFWLLKHPCQRVSDLSFVFQVHVSTICRQLKMLVKQALIESVTSTIASPHRPESLYYLTTKGIERIADLVEGVDPVTLAQMWQANENDLLHLLPRLHSSIPLQETVQRLIADAPHLLAYPGGYPAAIRWHWQRDYIHTFERKTKQLSCRADGAVVFRRRPLQQGMQEDNTEAWYCLFLLVDSGFHGSEDLRLIRKRLEQMLLWRESSERWPFYRAFPPLLVLTPTIHQRDLWIHCAQEAAAHLRVAPLHGACAMQDEGSPWQFSWKSLDSSGVTSLQSLISPIVPQAIPPGLLAPKPMKLEALAKRGKEGCKVVIGDFERRSKLLKTNETILKTTVDFALLSLHLCYRHMDLLKQIYASPLIAPRELAALLRIETETQRRYLYDLRHMNCIEMIATPRGKRLILTEAGLRLIAIMAAHPLIHIAERNVSTQQWQQRGMKLPLRTIEHTAGVYTFLAQLQQQAWKNGQEMLWWETLRSLRRYRYQGAWHNLMPDALFEYQAREARVEAWLEWDTGSMHGPSLTVKFEAYAQYVRSKQYRQDHLTPPCLLLVAPQNGREQMLRHLAVSVFAKLPLTVWTTTEPLVTSHGPLARIWKPLRPELDTEEERMRSTWVEE